jgi:hypothetical protein
MPDIDDRAAPWSRSGACPARCGLSEVTQADFQPLTPRALATWGPSKPMRTTGGVHRPAATYSASAQWEVLALVLLEPRRTLEAAWALSGVQDQMRTRS